MPKGTMFSIIMIAGLAISYGSAYIIGAGYAIVLMAAIAIAGWVYGKNYDANTEG
ncbi:hypothetical protein KKG82_06045 [Patescibacteria group bacterium]|nr:hypothetical protein [Patescibacteria group bacterium]